MPQAPEKRRSRFMRGKPADHAAHQSVEVRAESRTGSREHPVRAGLRDGDEAEDLEELLQVSAPALSAIGGLDPTHPTKHLPVAYPQNRAAKRGRSLEGAETVHGDVCRRISHPLRPLEGLGAVLDEEQAALPRELRYTTEIHAPAEQVRDQNDPRARREGRLKHAGPRRERPGVDVHRDGAQTVLAYDPNHVRVRNGRDENLIPCPQTLRTKPQVPPTPHRETNQPFFLQRAQPQDLTLQLLPLQPPAMPKNAECNILHRDVQPVPRV